MSDWDMRELSFTGDRVVFTPHPGDRQMLARCMRCRRWFTYWERASMACTECGHYSGLESLESVNPLEDMMWQVQAFEDSL